MLGRWFCLFGDSVIDTVYTVGDCVVLGYRTICMIFKARWPGREIFRQCVAIGNQSLGIVALTAIFTGMVLALQFSVGLGRFGLKLYTGQIIGLSITRELGPVLTSLMVAARVGAGIAAEIGSMMVTEQVLAIEAMGASPIQKLVVPRVIAITICLPLLAVIANALGILGGMVITMKEAGVTANFYMHQIWTTVGLDDFGHGIAKTVVFSWLIVLVACRQGLVTYGGTRGVGFSTTRAVVISSITILIADFFLTKIFLLF